MADRRIFGMAAGEDFTQHHLARAHTDAGYNWRAALDFELRSIVLECLLHCKSSMNCPLRMVLARDRSSKECENPIAGRLHYITFIPSHGLDHNFEHRIDNFASLLGIERLHQFGGSLD